MFIGRKLLLLILLFVVLSVSILTSYIILILSTINAHVFLEEITCVNEENLKVDWFFVYKFPKHEGFDISGEEYVTIDSRDPEWRTGRERIGSNKSILGKTLSPLYNTWSNAHYFLYNDNPPNSNNYSIITGHLKGALVWNKDGGFWLIHSVPKFPPTEGYGYPSKGIKYGQSFLCISLPFSAFVDLDDIFAVTFPRVYNCSVPEELTKMSNLCNKTIIEDSRTSGIVKIQSMKGDRYIVFGKSKSFSQDIVSGLMAPYLRSGLLSQTRQKLKTNCSIHYPVYNIKSMYLKSTFFPSVNDRSKLAVSFTYEDGWACVGDINRSPRQFQQGGGYVCTQNPNLYSSLRNSVIDYENCDSKFSSFIQSRILAFY
ncbi:ORF-14 [Teiidae poxvirus 1]|nr:ORF-14 [Teiidae poxvirus 1]